MLAESVLELREEVKWYLSFTDEEVFWGVALPKKEEEESPETLSIGDIPKVPCAPEETPNIFGVGESTTPILTSGGHQGDPPTIQGLKSKGRIKSTLLDDTQKVSSLSTEDSHPT